MTIKQSIYDNLNPSQRASAILEAVKRSDHTEAKRLMVNVERKIYEQADAEISDKLISQILADNAIDDKAGVYKNLLDLINRKERGSDQESSDSISSSVTDIMRAALASVERESERERAEIIAEYERERAQ
jgi:hypothetical protein